MTVFIDAGGWLSVLVESDQFHEIGKGYFDALMAIGGVATTPDFVLDEVVTRLRYDVGHARAAEFLSLVHEAIDEEILMMGHILQPKP